MSSNQWAVGQSVQLGGRTLRVTGRGEKRAKGEAAPWLLETEDGTSAYEWVPFRGLKLVRGEPVRPARAARRRAQRRAAKVMANKGQVRKRTRMVAKGGLFTRLLARFGKRNKRASHSTITRPPGPEIGH